MFYSVSVFLRNQRSDGQRATFEEQILLIEADSEEQAKEKASSLCKQDCTSYRAADGVEVTTTIEGIERAFVITDPLQDGSEIFSRFLSYDEAISILRTKL